MSTRFVPIVGVAAALIVQATTAVTSAVQDHDLTMWLFRGLLLASLAFNLHFLRKIYVKISHIDRVRAQIKTIITALKYLAQQADDSPGRRESDALILELLNDLEDKRGNL